MASYSTIIKNGIGLRELCLLLVKKRLVLSPTKLLLFPKPFKIMLLMKKVLFGR